MSETVVIARSELEQDVDLSVNIFSLIKKQNIKNPTCHVPLDVFKKLEDEKGGEWLKTNRIFHNSNLDLTQNKQVGLVVFDIYKSIEGDLQEFNKTEREKFKKKHILKHEYLPENLVRDTYFKSYHSHYQYHWMNSAEKRILDLEEAVNSLKSSIRVLTSINLKIGDTIEGDIIYKVDDEYIYLVAPASKRFRTDWCEATKRCEADGYELPSKEDLEEIHNLRKKIDKSDDSDGKFTLACFVSAFGGVWSSTEYSDNTAWYLYFSTGSLDYNSKGYNYFVVPVRKIKL